MNQPHPYTSLAGHIGCAICGKGRTFTAHLGQEEQESEDQGPPDTGPEPVAITAREYWKEYEKPIVASNFSITSVGGSTEIRITVAGPVTAAILKSASDFLSAVQPKEEAK